MGEVFIITCTYTFIAISKNILTFNLLLNRLSGIQPVLHMIGIRELQTKVVLFDYIQGVEDLLVQEAAQCLFLKTQSREN